MCKGAVEVFIKAKRLKVEHPMELARFTVMMLKDMHQRKMLVIRNPYGIKPAEGELLDRIASDYGVDREGRTDQELREAACMKIKQLNT